MKVVAIIYSSPYNKTYKRLAIVDPIVSLSFPNYPVNIGQAEKFEGVVETGGLPYCMYLGEKYIYNNGQYYHERYMERD